MSITPVIQIAVPTKLFDAAAVSTTLVSTIYATPARCPRFTAGTIFGTPPVSLTILIEASMDQSVWTTLSTLNATTGEVTGLVSNAAPFIRARMTAISGGSTVTLWINYKDAL